MKKSLLILASLLFISCSNYRLIKLNENQTAIKFKTATIEVDNELLDYVVEFIEEAYKHDIQVEFISRSYLGIYCDKTPSGMAGITVMNLPTHSYSLINCSEIKSNNKLRTVVFHEMGHKYITWEHCHDVCNEIMTSVINNRTVYGDWSQQKEVFFKNIKHDGINLPKNND